VAAVANLNLAVVYFRFPKKEEEEQLLASYHTEDTAQRPAEPTQLERPAALPSSR
jgi:hypothetical protein